jgi:hypothetical protein
MSTDIAKLTRRVATLEDTVSVLVRRLKVEDEVAEPSQRDAAGQRTAEMNKAVDDATHAAHEIDQQPDHPR